LLKFRQIELDVCLSLSRGDSAKDACSEGFQMKAVLVAIGLGMVAFNALAQDAAQKPARDAPDNPASKQQNVEGHRYAVRNPRYGLRPGDTFELSFSRLPEFNQTVPVQPDGFVTLREAGDLYVQGKTVSEVQQAVLLAYGKILHDPQITILLKDFEKPHFTVGGQVGKPGKYELRDDTTISEGIANAGGFTDRSKHSQILLFRRVSDDWVEVKKVDLKGIEKGNTLEDVHLRAGDMIVVPQNKISKIKPYLPVWALSTYLNPAHF
jgi:polysaccharide biosynthesis/export protein